MTKLMISRILLLIGVAVSLVSLWTTIVHVGDPTYVLIEASTASPHHPWQHNLREVIGDAAALTIFLMVFFGPTRFRSKESWIITLILMIGYFAGFWVGAPFLSELQADRWTGEAIHLSMAGFSLAALFTAKAEFDS